MESYWIYWNQGPTGIFIKCNCDDPNCTEMREITLDNGRYKHKDKNCSELIKLGYPIVQVVGRMATKMENCLVCCQLNES